MIIWYLFRFEIQYLTLINRYDYVALSKTFFLKKKFYTNSEFQFKMFNTNNDVIMQIYNY